MIDADDDAITPTQALVVVLLTLGVIVVAVTIAHALIVHHH